MQAGKEPGSHLDPQTGHYNSGIFMGFLSHLRKIRGTDNVVKQATNTIQIYIGAFTENNASVIMHQ